MPGIRSTLHASCQQKHCKCYSDVTVDAAKDHKGGLMLSVQHAITCLLFFSSKVGTLKLGHKYLFKDLL